MSRTVFGGGIQYSERELTPHMRSILVFLKENPRATKAEIAEKLNINIIVVREKIQSLRRRKLLTHLKKTGRWFVSWKAQEMIK